MTNLGKVNQPLYNITFTLGDPGGDGHGHYVVFHMQSNYSVQDITDAYNKATEMLGFDFIKTCCAGYNESYIRPPYASILVNYGVLNNISLTDVDFYGVSKGSYYIDDGVDEYIDIFIKIIKLVIKDFILEYRNLHEDALYILDYAAYGLTEYA